MPERDPIDLIREQLNRLEGLAGLHTNHEAFKKWYEETKTILEKAFSPKSIHCQSFLALKFREMGATPFSSPEIDKINAGRYKRDLEHAKNILHGAMKELTLDRTLFKKIQTTPESVEVTLKSEYYLSSGIDDSEFIQAIQSAFVGTGLSFLHGREFPLQQRIDQIKRASFGVYDISNPEKVDTLLEIGAALGLGKKVVIIYSRGSSIPESVKSLERIEYEDFPSLIEKLRKGVKF